MDFATDGSKNVLNVVPVVYSHTTAVLSWAAEMAIFPRPMPCPIASAVIAVRWFPNVRIGEFGAFWSCPVDTGLENDSNCGIDQTWTLASGEPDRTKLEVGSTTSEVTGWR